MRNLLKLASLGLLIGGAMLTSCSKDKPIYMNSKEGLTDAQEKVLKLADGAQIDSVSLRSTARRSLLSSMHLLLTDEKDQRETKSVVEFIPSKELNLREDSHIAKDALHSYKLNLVSLAEPIEKAKNMLPTGFTYKDVNRIMYAANVFEETYYIVLEVIPQEEYEEHEYVDEFFAQPDYLGSQLPESPGELTSNKYYIVTYVLKNNDLQMVKK